MEAFREVATDGALPSAPKTRAKLREFGHVAKPERNVADSLQLRITYLERTVTKIEPHPKLRPLLAGYAVRLRRTAEQLDALAAEDKPEVGPKSFA